jgi:hypothetical protein
MDEKELYPSLVDKLGKDFSLEKESLPVLNDLSVIREHLIRKIIDLMRGDYNRFLHNLYRIDLSEERVLAVLNARDNITIPEKLADLIIERQLQRVRTQILYREGKL